MKRIVKCNYCNGMGYYETVKKVFFNLFTANEKKVCPNCMGNGRVEHIQQQCKVCGQFISSQRQHKACGIKMRSYKIREV
jgi:DnaJ-class molecular chaperone